MKKGSKSLSLVVHEVKYARAEFDKPYAHHLFSQSIIVRVRLTIIGSVVCDPRSWLVYTYMTFYGTNLHHPFESLADDSWHVRDSAGSETTKTTRKDVGTRCQCISWKLKLSGRPVSNS